MKKFIIPLAIFVVNILIIKNTFDINGVLCKVITGTSCLYSLLVIINMIAEEIDLPFRTSNLAALSYFQLVIFNTIYLSDITDMVAVFLFLNAILSTLVLLELTFSFSLGLFIRNILNLFWYIPFATNAILLNKIFWLETTSSYEKIIYILAYTIFSKIIFDIVFDIFREIIPTLFCVIHKYSIICNQVAILIVSIIMKNKLPDTSLFYIVISSIVLITYTFNRTGIYENLYYVESYDL